MWQDTDIESSSGSWCIPETYEWEGRDFAQYPEDYCLTGDPEYDPPECYELGFNPQYETNDSSVVGLYEKKQVRISMSRSKSPANTMK
jgi:hypothetical protein